MTGENGTSQVGQSARKISALSIGAALATVAAAFALDRASKAWALANLQMHNSQNFIDGFLKLTLTTNTGAAFSLGANNSSFMTITAVVLTAALAFWLGSRIARGLSIPIMELIGLSCIIGGSLGNLTDRFSQGHVTDFLEFSFFNFPVFNVADTFINIGLGLVLLSRLLEDRANNADEPDSGDKPQTESERPPEKTEQQ